MPKAKDGQVVVVRRHGCFCCGTGCGVIGVLAPVASFALFETFGVLATVVGWLLVVVAANVVRMRQSDPS